MRQQNKGMKYKVIEQIPVLLYIGPEMNIPKLEITEALVLNSGNTEKL